MQVNPLIFSLQEILKEYETLLSQEPLEEELQQFLNTHSICLDPLSRRVRPKIRFGDKVSDFVLERFNGEYVLVELERSSYRLYTQAGNMTSQLTHAIGQTEDWKRFILDYPSYIRSFLGFSTMRDPEAWIIIGRSVDLSAEDKARLQEHNRQTRGHKQILTYDDLTEQMRTLIKNLSRLL